MRFRQAFYDLVPEWLRRGEGESILYSVGLVLDIFSERFRLAYESDLPEYAPDDALTYIGRDRAIQRGINEPSTAYASRLVRHLDDHRTQGNPFALMDQLYAYLQTDGVTIRTVDNNGNWFERASDGTRTYSLDQGNWDWDGDTTSWWRFWVIIFSDNGPWSAQWDPQNEGATSGTTTATADEIDGVRTLISEWKPAHARCEWIIVSFSAPTALFGPTTGDDPLGTYLTWGDGAAAGRPVRDSGARYWVGPR